jgi:DNA-binding CsgD family transcriptional regulator
MAGRGEAAGVRDRVRAGRGSRGTATARELAVVAAVVATGSEKAAAHRLGLSHSTVKHHLANARSRVGATTTAQLVWMLAERLPEPCDPEGRTIAEPIGTVARPSSVAVASASAHRKG